MFKKVIQGVVVGTAMFGLVGAAQAADRHINLYGASAQHLFWNDAATAFLNTKGCSSVQRGQTDSKNGITRGLTCSGYGNDNVYIRYSSKASFDGILAMKGDNSMTGSAEICNEGDPGVPAGQAGFYRKMVDEGSCTWTTMPATPGTCTASKCVDVTLGASDVAGVSFTQASQGQEKGPLGGAYIYRAFNGIDDSELDPYNPLIVPFGFFANNSIKKDGNTITNISRLQATQIFSGQAYYWTDFGANFSVTGDPNAEIKACFRHAGSGTHATLDYAVMKGNGWGWELASIESTTPPIFYFNDGSSDMMKCVNGSGAWGGIGAIGYADADQALALPANTVALTYQGEAPTRIQIRNGLYDFWSTQWLYEDPNEPNYAITHPVVLDLMTFASDPLNVPASKAGYWAAKDEMWYMKNTDQEYPGYTVPPKPQLP